MRQFSIWISLGLTLASCSPTIEKSGNNADSHQRYKQTNARKFFDYDEIEYYFNDYEEEKLGVLYDNQSKSKIDSLKLGVILGDIPVNISDLSFIENLEEIGYKKRILEKSKFADIDKIFVEKSVEENLTTACIYVYRDILIFKKNEKVVGTAKICFECMAYSITGTTANTENFGQDGDYDRLGGLLRQ